MANVQQIIVDELRRAGMSDAAIRGVLANVRDESNFNPTLRHPDQPKWSGEAHYAHGLYQEGGQEWNNYADWLKRNGQDGNWQDPVLQTRFLAERLKTGYPSSWEKINVGTPEVAAQTFVSEYLRPRADYLRGRAEKYARGVPEIADFISGSSTTSTPTPDAKTGMLAGVLNNGDTPESGKAMDMSSILALLGGGSSEIGKLATAAGYPETGGMLDTVFGGSNQQNQQKQPQQKAEEPSGIAAVDPLQGVEQMNKQALSAVMQPRQNAVDMSRLAQVMQNRMRLGV